MPSFILIVTGQVLESHPPPSLPLPQLPPQALSLLQALLSSPSSAFPYNLFHSNTGSNGLLPACLQACACTVAKYSIITHTWWVSRLGSGEYPGRGTSIFPTVSRYTCMDLNLNSTPQNLRTECLTDNQPGPRLAVGWYTHGTDPNITAKTLKWTLKPQPTEV